MYVLEIETNNKLKKIENPRKARIVDRIFFDTLQIMDDDGKWHTICNCFLGISAGKIMVSRINDTIRKKYTCIVLDI